MCLTTLPTFKCLGSVYVYGLHVTGLPSLLHGLMREMYAFETFCMGFTQVHFIFRLCKKYHSSDTNYCIYTCIAF